MYYLYNEMNSNIVLKKIKLQDLGRPSAVGNSGDSLII